MKKLFLYATVAALAMTAASCQKESMDENGSKDGPVFTASIDNGMDTKTILTSERKVNWESTDEITVNGVVYTAALKSDSTKADFTKKNSGDADPTGTFNAFYPTGIQDGNNAGGALPETQTYAEGKITNVPMFATSSTNSLSFKNICAVLAVTVKNEDFSSVKSIKVSSSNKAMSGEFTIESDDTNSKAVLKDSTNAANTVTLDCGTPGVTTASEGTVFYIAIPAQTYKDLKIELSADGSSYTKSMTTKKNAEVAVNKVYSVTFKADAAATTGTAKATINGSEVDVEWVQLWTDGPKFAVMNVGASTYTDKGSIMTFTDAVKTGADYVWGSNWKTPSKDEMDLLNIGEVSCTYCQESGVYGFKFTGVKEGYKNNSLFLPVDGGASVTGNAVYWSSTAVGNYAWYLRLNGDYDGYYDSDRSTSSQSNEYYVRPVLSN